MGWQGGGGNIFLSLIGQKSLPVIVAGLVIFFVVFNLTSQSSAAPFEEIAGRTFLSEIITSELSQNDELVEEYFDEEAYISPAQQTYLDNLAMFKQEPMAEMKAADEIERAENLAGQTEAGNAIIKPEFASTQKSKRPRTEIVTYTVQIGDTVSTIAGNFDISVNTILWENNLNAYSLIRPGDKLAILPVSGITYKVARGDTLSRIASSNNIEEAQILEVNKIAPESQLAVGQKIIIPGGRKQTYTARTSSGLSGLSALSDLLRPNAAIPAAGNKMNWPTLGYRITQYYSWRHYAVDIANKKGTPVYAVDAGVVEYIGWGTGYGNQIIIDHGGGKKTRYAHLSKFYVAKGQQVKKGTAIAAMGSTGWSTGPHLHFEIIINGYKYNPLNYIK